METYRLFAAAPLPSDAKHALAAVVQPYRDSLPFRKWVHRDDYHITLAFLGDTPANTLKDVVERLREAAASAKPFAMSAARLGVFGAPAAPSVLWAGTTGDSGALAALQQSVEAQLTRIGYKPEKRVFKPHITIARSYQGSEPFTAASLKAADAEQAKQPIDWLVDAVVLYRTHMHRAPMYEEVARLPFSSGSQPAQLHGSPASSALS